MHEMIVMHIPDGTSKIIKNRLGFFFRDSFVLNDIVEKLLPWA